MNLNKNQKNQQGGKRDGAGRPKGTFNKPQIGDFVNKKEVKELMVLAKDSARNGDSNILKFLLDHILGKAPQSIDAQITGNLSLSEIIRKAKGINE